MLYCRQVAVRVDFFANRMAMAKSSSEGDNSDSDAFGRDRYLARDSTACCAK